MITVMVRERNGAIDLLARFEDAGVIGSGAATLKRGEEYLGVPFRDWEAAVGTTIMVAEDRHLELVVS